MRLALMCRTFVLDATEMLVSEVVMGVFEVSLDNKCFTRNA